METNHENRGVEPSRLTSEQKKTIWEWVKYLTKELAVAILKKLGVWHEATTI